MNKMIKGSVAGATGIALLMGGFGTYALWNDSTSVNDSVLRSGALDILHENSNGRIAAGNWTDGSPGATDASWSPLEDYMVPGDKVTLTQPISMDVKGTHLGVTFTVTGIDSSAWSNLDVVGSLDGTQPLTRTATGFQNTFAAPAGTNLNGDHNLVITFTFTDTSGATDQNETLSLNNVGIEVAQTSRP